ncbi:probable histone acetyltransferase HAC-like 1 isoform X2 [Phragmites australis]|uniref:probable histone acetyltransferase HAC-like 1 isoform X2 n=1 Tax=Phragmites australis TaxID=29695 RepID=UPI002D777E7D|nr:probable histone acetyltransferase HAC-like 1 isoform X2 [Phragmites australis]
MNVGQAAHLSGQMSVQAAQMNQVGSVGVGVGGADGLPQHQQMQDVVGLGGVDAQFVMLRRNMRDKIFEYIGRKQSSAEWRRRLPELARRLEEILFRKFSNKNEYYNMMKGPVEPQLQFAIKILSAQNQQNQQMSRQIASSSSYGTMIPTPGMAPQNANMGTSMPGSISNGYQHLTAPQNSLTNSVQSTMGSVGVQRMIPTPGFTNQQNVPGNPDYSNGAGCFNGESAVVPHIQHQKQFPSNQNSQPIQHIGGHSNSGVHSGMLDNSSAYGLSDGHMNGGMGLHGSNMQLTNRTTSPEAYLNISPYGSSPKPLQQQFNQLPPQRIPTSVNMAGSGSFYATGSSALATGNNQSTSAANLQSRSRINPMLVNNQLNIQSIQPQPQIKTEVLDQPEKVNFQSSQLTHEQLLRQQHSIQQHQVQPNSQFVQNQFHLNQQQPNPQHQQAMLRSNSFKQSQLASSHSMQLSEQGGLPHNELISSQATDPVDHPNFQGQYQQRSGHDNVKGGQMFGHLSGSQNFHASVSHDSQQLLPPNPQLNDGSNDVSYVLKGSQTDQMLQLQWQPQTIEKAPVTANSSLEKQIQEGFCQRPMAQDGAQQPFSSDWRLSHGAVTSTDPALPKPPGGGFEQITGNIYYVRQIKWLLLLLHAKACSCPIGSCKFHHCVQVQDLYKHFQNCQRKDCSYRDCSKSKMVSQHYKTCVDEQCPVCSNVKNFLRRSAEQASKQKALESRKFAQQSTPRISNGVEGDRMDIDPVSVEAFDDQRSAPKRLKMQPASPSAPENEISVTSNPHVNPEFVSQERHPELVEHNNKMAYLKREVDVKADLRVPQKSIKTVYGIDGNVPTARHNVIPGVLNETNSHINQENLSIDKETSGNVLEVNNETNDSTDATVSKSGKPKIKGGSLTELFTLEQIKEHIDSLRLWIGQSKAKAEKNQAIGHSENENSCQLCRVEKLTFEPPPIYCSPCGARIKRNAPYYTVGTGDTRHYFCIPCYNESRGETIEVEGQAFLKAKFEKKRNDEETEESWVQCDKCGSWKHQICALFNKRRNDGGQAEYTCPDCYVEEVKRGLRVPLPQSTVLGAKDLPRTVLSDHIEDRLFKRLKLERQDRAAAAGKSFDEVPGAEGLVVRVVSSVDKKLEVKPRFLEIFQEDNYPTEFAYKSKAVLLFQKIEGVEVCLFGMYVQEFGAECSFPNQRRVYLSYLDSVKYFRPEIRTVSGEALRTFVYHEILIGYLEYCKLRGFSSCYIWACPPLKGEDYILYCHPEIQKTPKSDKLREWYLSMLRKASTEKIVVELTNLYDNFFTTTGECKAKMTAARLPYFDGDYWPGAAEDMINQLRQEEDDRKLQKKSKTKKIITKRTLKAAGHTDLTGNASKDAMLMHKLGETICPMKEDFIMVHLQYSCSHCCILMVSGRRWVCHQCRSFYICDKCYDAEQQLEERERHPSNSKDTHTLHPVDIVGVPKDTKDRDDILESEFFDTRQAFLSLCQGNHYQYDTLRRAKHSSMMVLYHLHNPTAPAFVTTCNVCCHDIETGQGWRCEVCSDFDVCDACFQKGAVNHPHTLTNHPSAADRDAQNKEARQLRVQQLRKMLDLLVHASTCRSGSCQYPNCRKVKGLFRHGMQCKKRASGGCVLCKKMWYMLQLHARACKDSDCNVPRCRDLKEHLRRLQQQSDSRRRAAVNEMMRQRAAEVAANE